MLASASPCQFYRDVVHQVSFGAKDAQRSSRRHEETREGLQDGSEDVRSRLVICCVFIFLSFWALTCHETHRLLKGDIDGVLLVAICLLVGSIFPIQLLLLVRSIRWLDREHQAIV